MERHGIIREGAIAGIIGATVVALWFLIIDLVAGHLFFTPQLLGRSVLSVFGPRGGEGAVFLVAFYTVIHYAAFILVGIIAAAIVRAGEREPTLLAGALILFVAIEIGFYGLTALLAQASPLGTLAWYQIGLANLLAALAMGAYLWRANPALGRRLGYALQGRE
jgi:hypothetical protein